MKLIDISTPKFPNKFTMVDDEDFEYLNQWKWRWMKKGYVFRFNALSNDRRDALHRFLMGAPNGLVVDHINGDTTDNRKSNLRICAQYQNMYNQKLRCDNTSGFKGATWHAFSGLWHATIKAKGKLFSLGYHKTAKDAAKVYDSAALRLHGEFARTNKSLGLLD